MKQKNRRGWELLIGVLFVLNLAFPYYVHAASSAGLLYLTPGSGNYNPGDTINIQLRENSGPQVVNVAQINLSYPTSALQFISASNSSAFNIPVTNIGGGGSVQLEEASTSSNTGDQAVASMQFKVLGNGRVSININNSLVLGGGAPVNFTAAGSSYMITSPAAITPEAKSSNPPSPVHVSVPSPSASVSAVVPPTLTLPSKPASFYKMECDFDFNRRVDIFDLTQFLDHYHSHESIYDINNDAKINVLDLSVFISNYNS